MYRRISLQVPLGRTEARKTRPRAAHVADIRPRRGANRRSTEDFANINGFSMMVFIILMALLTHGHGMSFQNRCLGFPKRPCFPKFMKMVAHGAPVTDGLDEFRSLRSEDTKRYNKS